MCSGFVCIFIFINCYTVEPISTKFRMMIQELARWEEFQTFETLHGVESKRAYFPVTCFVRKGTPSGG
jgi:hypothetical protein